MARTVKATAKRTVPQVVLGYNQQERNWLLIVNTGVLSRHHQLRTRSVVSRDEAIAEAKEILKRYGIKWSAKVKVVA